MPGSGRLRKRHVAATVLRHGEARRSLGAGNRVERAFRGEFRHRVLAAATQRSRF